MFQLPPDISQKKIQIPEGWAYVFRHTDLGELGCILLTTHIDGRTIISASITGHEDDPMTAKRSAIFKPLGNKLIKAYEDVMAARGHKHSEPIAPPVVRVTKQIATKMLQCNTCGKNVGLLILPMKEMK